MEPKQKSNVRVDILMRNKVFMLLEITVKQVSKWQ